MMSLDEFKQHEAKANQFAVLSYPETLTVKTLIKMRFFNDKEIFHISVHGIIK